MMMPPAIIQHAAAVCSAQTWTHPERASNIGLRHGNAVVRVKCHRTENNTLVFDRVRITVTLADSLEDPMQLVATEAAFCAPFASAKCEVDVE